MPTMPFITACSTADSKQSRALPENILHNISVTATCYITVTPRRLYEHLECQKKTVSYFTCVYDRSSRNVRRKPRKKTSLPNTTLSNTQNTAACMQFLKFYYRFTPYLQVNAQFQYIHDMSPRRKLFVTVISFKCTAARNLENLAHSFTPRTSDQTELSLRLPRSAEGGSAIARSHSSPPATAFSANGNTRP